jgi:hypothetical protein
VHCIEKQSYAVYISPSLNNNSVSENYINIASELSKGITDMSIYKFYLDSMANSNKKTK